MDFVRRLPDTIHDVYGWQLNEFFCVRETKIQNCVCAGGN